MSSSGGSITKTIGAASATVAAVGAIALGIGLAGGGSGGSGGGITCDLNAANSTQLATQVSAATTGQTVCLTASVSYGTWTGVNKAITIAAASGVSPTIALNLSSAHLFTINGGWTGDFSTGTGLTVTSFDTILTSDSATNFTIKNTEFGANGVQIDNVASAGIVFDHDHWHDIHGDPPGDPAAVWQPDGGSGLTVKNSLIENMDSDGINLGGSNNTITGNDFNNVYPEGHADLHTDNLQWVGGIPGTVISGNFVYGSCEQGISGFDGSGSMTYEDNVIIGCTAWSGEFGGDRPGSTVDHNTIIGAALGCGSKAAGVGSPNGPSLTSLHDNFFAGGGGLDLSGIGSPTGPDCTPGLNSNNLTSTPTFVGGSTPTTYAGYALATGSAGKGTATDGGDVGARVGNWPRPSGMP